MSTETERGDSLHPAGSASPVVGDGDRLDYMERNPQRLAHCCWWNANRGQIFSMGHDIDPTIGDCHTTLRAAIDRALAVERAVGAETQNAPAHRPEAK